MGRLAGAARADMSVDGTRFVYPAREKAISVYVGNIGAEPILVQSWLDRGEARDANDLARLKVPFVLTPPLLRLEPNERKAVQLRYTGESLPKDRESLFWVNFLEVPVVSDEQNNLRLQLNLSMKVLFRPEGLQGKQAMRRASCAGPGAMPATVRCVCWRKTPLPTASRSGR